MMGNHSNTTLKASRVKNLCVFVVVGYYVIWVKVRQLLIFLFSPRKGLKIGQAYLPHDGSTLQTNKPRSLLNFTSPNRSLAFDVVIATPAFLR